MSPIGKDENVVEVACDVLRSCDLCSPFSAVEIKKAMGTNPHGLHDADTKKPWGPIASPMAPCHDMS